MDVFPQTLVGIPVTVTVVASSPIYSPTAAARHDDVVILVFFVGDEFFETHTRLIHPVLEGIPDDSTLAIGCKGIPCTLDNLG